MDLAVLQAAKENYKCKIESIDWLNDMVKEMEDINMKDVAYSVSRASDDVSSTTVATSSLTKIRNKTKCCVFILRQ